MTVHSFRGGLAGARAKAAVHLTVSPDSARGGEPMLLVEYPAPNGDPAFRDVQLDAERTDWSAAKALRFDVQVAHAIRLSVSFVDRHHVVYTAWTNVQAGAWQTIRIVFDAMRPNPYFQPPDAEQGAPLDVTDVKGVAFAPQDPQAGRLAITDIILVK